MHGLLTSTTTQMREKKSVLKDLAAYTTADRRSNTSRMFL